MKRKVNVRKLVNLTRKRVRGQMDLLPNKHPEMSFEGLFREIGHVHDRSEDQTISSKPLSFALCMEGCDPELIHVRSTSISVAFWKYAMSLNGTVFSKEDKIGKLLFDTVPNFDSFEPDEPDKFVICDDEHEGGSALRMYCCLYKKMGSYLPNKKFVGNFITLKSFSDQCPDVIKNLDAMGLTEQDEMPFKETLNAVIIASHSYNVSFPKQSVSVAFAVLMIALNGHSMQDEILVHGQHWRASRASRASKKAGDQEGDKKEGDVSKCKNLDDVKFIEALTDFLSSMCYVFNKILEDHPDFDTGGGVLKSGNNIVCCCGSI